MIGRVEGRNRIDHVHLRVRSQQLEQADRGVPAQGADFDHTPRPRCDQGRLDDLVPQWKHRWRALPGPRDQNYPLRAPLRARELSQRGAGRDARRRRRADCSRMSRMPQECERLAGRSRAAFRRRVGAGAGARTRRHAGRHPCAETGASDDRVGRCTVAGSPPGRRDTCIRVGLRSGAAARRVRRPPTRRKAALRGRGAGAALGRGMPARGFGCGRSRDSRGRGGRARRLIRLAVGTGSRLVAGRRRPPPLVTRPRCATSAPADTTHGLGASRTDRRGGCARLRRPRVAPRGGARSSARPSRWRPSWPRIAPGSRGPPGLGGRRPTSQ